MPSNRVVVLGSANADLVLSLPRLPGAGETLLASRTARFPGGKGANQAVAAARAGVDTALLGALGDDADGQLLRDAMTAAGVDIGAVRTSAEATGLAVVMVDDAGQNSIVVAAGANAELRALSDAELAIVRGAGVLLCQLEVPLPVVTQAVAAAHAAGVRVVLNAAPSQSLPAELLDAVDVLVVNEYEAVDVAGVERLDDALVALLRLVPAVVVTLGGAGARVLERPTGAPLDVHAPSVEVVDTTGAGDTFCGVLSASLSGGASLADGVRRAVVAGALSVQKRGAIPSVPTAAEVGAAMDDGR